MAVRLSVRHPESAAGQTGEVSYELDQGRIALGRGAGADVRLPHLSVSEAHAILEQQGSHYTLRDEGSSNGTRVNGVALVALRPRQLAEGDQIEIGEFTLTFSTGPLRGQPVSPERTASLARRMLREMLGNDHAASSPPFLRVSEGPDAGVLVNLAEPPSKLLVGRGEEAGLTLDDPDVSRLHLEVVRDQDGATVRDLESKNGLEVNGKRMRERRLRHGDSIRLGATVLVFQEPSEEALRALEGKSDVTLTRERPAAEAVPEPDPTAKPVGAIETLPPPAEAGTGTDMLVYALALAVLVASILGLAWLFGS